MPSIIEKREEHILTRAQFEQLKANGNLVIGAIYNIKDDPSALDIVDGNVIAKKAEQDSNGNIIITTYRRIDDSYSKIEVDELIRNNVPEIDLSQYYTKEQVDELLPIIIDLEAIAGDYQINSVILNDGTQELRITGNDAWDGGINIESILQGNGTQTLSITEK